MSIIKKDQKINIFLQVLAAETGASKNTLLAYEKDLVLADSHTQSFFDKNLSSANERELLSCLSRWQKQGKSAKTITRRISALKQMMKWLVSDGYRTDNPTTWLDNPKLPQTIPFVLIRRFSTIFLREATMENMSFVSKIQIVSVLQKRRLKR